MCADRFMVAVVVVIAAAAWARGADAQATPAARIRLLPGFRAERLYSVPKKQQGSWVNITFDPKGRLIASDQYGALYRITPPPPGGRATDTRVERLAVKMGGAQGLLYARGSLFVVVNGNRFGGSGLYRLRDTNGDDQFDKIERLKALPGGGEHGPHAVALGPGGRHLYLMAGNGTRLPQGVTDSRVPRVWAEDQLLPRTGYRGVVPPPGGWVCRIDPETNDWELFCTGFRNAYDIAFNRHGDLFTYDSDNERDVGTSWYRPTRVCHVVSGGEFGWRSGSGKWPAYYAESLPPAVELGKGSPTGIAFGTGLKFPRKYREALYALDWTFGRIHAVHLKAHGSSYTGTSEVFLSGRPLPVTDVAAGPDGALYFITGGRRTQSGLYRVTYAGAEPVDDAASKESWTAAHLREVRRNIERLHGPDKPLAVARAWPHLSSSDRFVRAAARVALEHAPVAAWQERALDESDPQARIAAMVALARVGHASLKDRMLASLGRIDAARLCEAQTLEMLRAYALTFIRMGAPEGDVRTAATERLGALYPADAHFVNKELSRLLVFLRAPGVIGRTLDLIAKAKTQEEQIHFALVLRLVKDGWTIEQRKTYFRWFNAARKYEGGEGVGNNPAKSRQLFRTVMGKIRDEAAATLRAGETAALREILAGEGENYRPPEIKPAAGGKPVHNWRAADLLPALDKGLRGRSFARGRAMFRAAQCARCHRFAGDGTAYGPDLTAVVSRFGAGELLESILEPSKVVSDQYALTRVVKTDGTVVAGRLTQDTGAAIVIATNPYDPNEKTTIAKSRIRERRRLDTSPMPAGLLNVLNRDEALDLLAYLLSRGNPADEVFEPAP